MSTWSSCCSTFFVARSSKSIVLQMLTATLRVPRAVSMAAPSWLMAMKWGGEMIPEGCGPHTWYRSGSYPADS